MPVYHIAGKKAKTGQDVAFFIEDSSLLSAIEVGSNRGLIDIEGQVATPGLKPLHAVNSPDRPIRRKAKQVLLDSDLLVQPVKTIAKGVFLGMLFWTIFKVLLYLLIRLIFGVAVFSFMK